MAKSTRDRSIWNYLLIGTFVFTAAVMVLLIAGAFLVPVAVNHTIQKYTDAAPQEGEPIEVSDRQYATLRERVDDFADAVDRGDSHAPLILSSEEVASLIQREVQAELNKGTGPPPVQLWLRVDGDRLRGPVSIRTDDFATGMLSGLKGRYLNGIATLNVVDTGDEFAVRLDNFTIDGNPIPGWVRNGLQDAIDSEVAKSRELRDAARKLGGIELHDGKAIIRSGH